MIIFEEEIEKKLKNFIEKGILKFYHEYNEIKQVIINFKKKIYKKIQVIEEILQLDPRSIYRKEKFLHEIYGFCIDTLNIKCQFLPEEKKIIIIDIEDWSFKYSTF